MKRVLLRAPNWLGDCIMTLWAANEYSKTKPDCKFDVLCRSSVAAIFGITPLCDQIHVLPDKKGIGGAFARTRFLRNLPERYDVGLLMPNSIGSAVSMKLVGAKSIVGYARDSRSAFLDVPIRVPEWEKTAHLTSYYLRIFEAMDGMLCAPPTAVKPDGLPYSIPAEETSKAIELIERYTGAREYLAMAAGSAYGPTRSWSVEGYAEVARQCIQRGMHVLLLGSKKDSLISAAIAEAAGKGATDVCGMTSIPTAAALLSRASGYIGNDSGLTHLAGWMGTPSVCLFLSTDPVRTGAIGPRMESVIADVPCRPCFQKQSKYNFACRNAITPSAVMEALKRAQARS